jgi:hypothetical protein
MLMKLTPGVDFINCICSDKQDEKLLRTQIRLSAHKF